MNPQTLKVMACPLNAGRHPFHDNRWIATSDAKVEWNTNETEWRLREGSLICEMRDCQNQEQLARLFSKSPETYSAVRDAVALLKSQYVEGNKHRLGALGARDVTLAALILESAIQ